MKIMKPLLLIVVLLVVPGRSFAAAGRAHDVRDASVALSAGNYGKAFALYSRSAQEEDNPLAQFFVGLFYKNGWGRQADPVTACQWFGKAAEGGIPVAQHFYGECLEEGIGCPADPSSAAVWYEKAAEGGHHISYCYLAELYMAGRGVAKDPAKAIELCGRSAGQGSPQAQVRLGRFYLEGDESVRDYAAAFRWFAAAEQKNVPEAQYYMGYLLDRGLVITDPPQSARVYFERAAAQGYAPAYFPTGRLYFNAPVDPQTKALPADDLAKAYLWLSAAVQRSQNREEAAASAQMLEQIRNVMPKAWAPELDAKVAEHVSKYAK